MKCEHETNANYNIKWEILCRTKTKPKNMSFMELRET